MKKGESGTTVALPKILCIFFNLVFYFPVIINAEFEVNFRIFWWVIVSDNL